MDRRVRSPDGPGPWRARSAWWLLLAVPGALVVAAPLAVIAAFAECGLGSCSGRAVPGATSLAFAALLWSASGAVAALPWVLIRWAPARVRWSTGGVLAFAWAVTGLVWTPTT